MKNFESKIINSEFIKSFDKFLLDFEIFKIQTQTFVLDAAKRFYNVPDFILDEYSILYFYYNEKRKWQDYDYSQEINNYIKKEVKKLVIKNVIKKMENDSYNYIVLNDYLNDIRKKRRYNSNKTFDFIIFLFEKILKYVPEIIKNMNKYNL